MRYYEQKTANENEHNAHSVLADYEPLKSRVNLKDLPYYRDRIAKERIANVVVYVLLLFAGATIMGALSALI